MAPTPSATFRPSWIWTALWAVVVATGLIVRPPLPVDETRYLAVAWDMWLEGHYLVPYLNGEPYSHKPPLLFWLMTAGWHLFGVNDWWPRLVAPLFGLGCLFLTARLGRALWPDRADIARRAPFVLFACLFWTIFTTLTMFDMMLAFFALAALIGLIDAARRGTWRGFFLAGAALGFGVLAKGPAVLLHFLPVALAAPWWLTALNGPTAAWTWGRWYAGVFAGVAVAAAIGLAWAVPAGIAGGETYRDAIFWGQSAGRVVNSFAHARPFWWYAAVLPGLVLPWLLWPPLWRALGRLPAALPDGGVRLILVWMGTAFVVFSLVSGKQLHYLLPEFPALALLGAYLLGERWEARRGDSWVPGGFLVVVGLVLLAAPWLPLAGPTGSMLSEVQTGWGLLVVSAGLLTGLWPRPVLGVGVAATAVIVAAYMALAPVLAERYDLAPVAARIKAIEDSGKRTANFGKYHGQYHYLGRLRLPVPVMGQREGDEAAFLDAFPDGYVVAYYRNLPEVATPVFTHTYRRMTIAIWPAQALIDHPGLGERR